MKVFRRINEFRDEDGGNSRMGIESDCKYMDFNEQPNFKFGLGWKTFKVSKQFRDEYGKNSKMGIGSDCIYIAFN